MPAPKIVEKKWSKDTEGNVIKGWVDTKKNKPNPNSGKPFYIIDTPPPYINAPIHIGHATVYAMQDMYARFYRMLGYEVVFPLGLDTNGIPIEVAAEKRFGIKINELPREEAIEYCKKILDETSTESIKTFVDLACSFSSWDFHTGEIGEAYYTGAKEYRALTQDTFIDIWNKGLVYFDKRINNYSPGLKTTIADSEIDYEDLPSKLVHVKWKVKETGEEIIIATTRPELIASCGMVIFNPEDDRYKHLDGKTALTPIYGKEVPIQSHTDAKMEKGSGIVMMCSAGDYTDIRFFREQELEPIISINENGEMNDNAGFLEGVKVAEARKKMIEELENNHLVEKIEDTTHRTPICERSKQPVEFIEMEEIYVKQKEFLDDIREISKQINFYSPNSIQILHDWLDSISIDWPVSRRRVYATEIPLWHCKNCGKSVVPEDKGKYWQPWKDPCPVEKCPECGASDWEGEKRVFDTWFDSSISPLFNMKYNTQPEFFKKVHKCTLRPQGKEIVRTWLYYSLLRNYQLLGRPIFENVWIHHHVVDEHGRKFSKSLGNGIDPQEILQEYGAEAFRLWVVTEGNIHEDDLRCSFERITAANKTLIKLWNVARFISTFDYDSQKEYVLCETDKWILNELNTLIERTTKAYNEYDFHNPAKDIRHFLTETFASHYLELVKQRAYNEGHFSEEEQMGALYTLNKVLSTILQIWAPVLPIITYKIYNELYGVDVHDLEFPKETDVSATTLKTDDIIEANSQIWKFKKDNSLSMKSGLKKATVSENLKPLEKDFVLTHNIEEISYGEYQFEKQ